MHLPALTAQSEAGAFGQAPPPGTLVPWAQEGFPGLCWVTVHSLTDTCRVNIYGNQRRHVLKLLASQNNDILNRNK